MNQHARIYVHLTGLFITSVAISSCGSPISNNEPISEIQSIGSTSVEYISTVIRDLEYNAKINTKVCYGVFAGPEGFPQDSEKIVLSGCVDVNSRIVSFLIDDLPPTQDGYAISFFQDMNGNGILDTRNMFGFKVPDEPFGFTNNPNLRGAPRYEDVRIDPVKNGEKIEIFMKKI